MDIFIFIFCKNYDGDGPFLFLKKPVFDEKQCDQLIILFFDFGHLQLRKIAQEHIIFAKYVKNFKKHYKGFEKLPKRFFPKWWNFAKSGHTVNAKRCSIHRNWVLITFEICFGETKTQKSTLSRLVHFQSIELPSSLPTFCCRVLLRPKETPVANLVKPLRS